MTGSPANIAASVRSSARRPSSSSSRRVIRRPSRSRRAMYARSCSRPRSRRRAASGRNQSGAFHRPSATPRSRAVRWRLARWFARSVAESLRVPSSSFTRALGAELRQASRQVRPLPFFLVLQEHVGVVPRLLADAARPRAQLLVAEVLAPKPEVAPVGGGDERYDGPLSGVGDAERRALCAQEIVHLVVEPRRVPELDGCPPPLGHVVEETLQPRHVLLEIRRQLEEEG